MNKNRDFAFGRNNVGDCTCPALTAGFNPEQDNSTHIAEAYDEEIQSLSGISERNGIVCEEVAREAWIRALDSLETLEWVSDENIEAGREIAKTLGWN